MPSATTSLSCLFTSEVVGVRRACLASRLYSCSRNGSISMLEHPRRRTVVLWLLGFVVVFGGVSWIVTGGIGRLGAPHPATVTPGATPALEDCNSPHIQFVGVFNDCASIDRTSADNCAVAAHKFYAAFPLIGRSHRFVLYLSIPYMFAEPGDYFLASGGAEVDVSNAMGAIWRSVSGVITTTGLRSGTVNAILQIGRA